MQHGGLLIKISDHLIQCSPLSAGQAKGIEPGGHNIGCICALNEVQVLKVKVDQGRSHWGQSPFQLHCFFKVSLYQSKSHFEKELFLKITKIVFTNLTMRPINCIPQNQISYQPDNMSTATFGPNIWDFFASGICS